MDDTALRAARMMGSQGAMLRQRMATAQQSYHQTGSMLFKRTVRMSRGTDLDRLLMKWNPGVTAETIDDLVTSVIRWNQLPDTSSIKPGQQILIPTVVPHGQRPPAQAPSGIPRSERWEDDKERPRPPRRPKPVPMDAQLTEKRIRSTPGIWAINDQHGMNLAGARVKQQFQANIWDRRG